MNFQHGGMGSNAHNANKGAGAPGTAYMFDIIVVRIDVPVETFPEPRSLVVDVHFNRADIKVTSSRINVVEFRAGRSYEFSANPLELKENLKKNPLKLELKYENRLIGKGEIPWSESFLERINDCAGELTNCGETDLLNTSGLKVGSMEVFVRLQTKCKEYMDPDFSLSQMPENICKQMEKVIDPNDILFVVGEDKESCQCADVGIIPATDSEGSMNATCLDLTSFRNINGKTLNSPDILNNLDPMYCSHTQKISQQYQGLLRNSPTRARRSSHPCCSQKQPLQHSSCYQNEIRFPKTSSSDLNLGPCRCCSDNDPFANQNAFHVPNKLPAPELKQTIIKRSRCCPICKENLAWLPKMAACPKCAYKPVPQFKETPFDENLTANDIVNDYLENKSSCSEESLEDEKDNKKKCNCTCDTKGVLCAYCRIRKLCADIFQPTPKPKDCNTCDDNSVDGYNICESGSKECRPYLARVFSELRQIYDIKDIKEKRESTNARCESVLNQKKFGRRKPGADSATGSRKARDIKERNQQEGSDEHKKGLYKRLRQEKLDKKKEFEKERRKYLVENFKKSAPMCNTKTYTYKPVRTQTVPKSAHKTCVNGFAGRKNVPPNMGWLWNLNAKGSRTGWKPGAIRKPIKKLMQYFLKDYPVDTIRVSQYSYRKKDQVKKEPELVQLPTLHIFKKNGEYNITLRPLKDPEALKECADPYLDMKPIQFKIVKNPIVVEMRKLKRCLKDQGFKKCTCHKPILFCYCRSFLEKKRLEYECNKETRKRCMPSVTDKLVLSDTTDSDVEFDFGVTPPAGLIKPEKLKKPDLANHGTQYVEGDWNVPPMYPREPNKYMKLYNCAVGERYGKAFGPYGEGGYAPGAKVDPCGPAALRGDGKGGKGGGRGGKGGIGGGKGGPGGKGGADFLRQKGGSGDGGGKESQGGKDGQGGNGKGGKGGKIDMMKYLQQKNKEARGQKKRREIPGSPPPLLCMIDRRGKPIDPCAPCVPCEPVCYSNGCYTGRCDPRIC